MTRKKKTEADAAVASAPQAAPAPEAGPMVTVLKTATATKLSPRGDGALTYQLGRMDDTVLLRIHENESSGRFSKEWVTVEAVRRALAALPKGTTAFKGALALKAAWKGLSSCNSGFGAAILKAEGVFAWEPDKKGMMRLASPDALDAWERAVLALKVPKDAERVPLNPPRPVPHFAKRNVPADAPAPVEEVGQVEDAGAGDDPAADGDTE